MMEAGPMPSPRNTVAVLLALPLVLSVFDPAPAVGTLPSPPVRSELPLQRKNHEDFLRSLPLLDKHAVREVFQLRIDNGRLVLRSPLPPTQGYERMRAELEGLCGPLVVERRRLAR